MLVGHAVWFNRPINDTNTLGDSGRAPILDDVVFGQCLSDWQLSVRSFARYR